MAEIRVGDFVYDRLTGKMTVYEVGGRLFKAAPGGEGGWPEYTVNIKTMIPLGKKARHGKLMTHAEWLTLAQARRAVEWIEHELSWRRILASDVVRAAKMLGWSEVKNG